MEDGTRQKLVDLAWNLAAGTPGTNEEVLATFRVYYHHLAVSVRFGAGTTHEGAAAGLFKQTDEDLANHPSKH
jgi:hypothetical protein